MELVLIAITTKPCEATRLASQAIEDLVAVNPGLIATPPNVPAEVVVGL